MLSRIQRFCSVLVYRTAGRALPFLFCAYAASAQVTAVLSGTVSDSSGGTVRAAKVTVTNADTGSVRDTETDAVGRYHVASLPVGEYQVRASKTGFSDELRKGIQLAVGQAATVDLTMQVGQVSQTVSVTGDAPLVENTTADISANGQIIHAA